MQLDLILECPAGSLQISFEPRGFDSRLGDGGRSSAAWELQHGEGPPPDGPGTTLTSMRLFKRSLQLTLCVLLFCVLNPSSQAAVTDEHMPPLPTSRAL